MRQQNGDILKLQQASLIEVYHVIISVLLEKRCWKTDFRAMLLFCDVEQFHIYLTTILIPAGLCKSIDMSGLRRV